MHRKIIPLIASMAVAASVSAQPVERKIWPAGAPNSNGIATPEASYGEARVGNVSDPRIYIYLPQHASKPTPAVLICPGGGYARLAMQHEGTQLAQWLNEQGVAGIVLKYRMPNGHCDVPLSDAQQALRMVRDSCAKWNIDARKVGIAGSSAGGHLAATALTHWDSRQVRPDFGVLFYPVVSMDSTVSHRGSRSLLLGANPSPALVREYSNALHVSAETPPTILLLSDDDKTVPPANSVEFYDALKKNNVRAAMYIFPTGGHGWGMRSSFAYHAPMLDLLKRWLQAECSAQ